MIDWLLKHPLVIFVIIMVVSTLFKQLKSSGEAPPPAPGPSPFGRGDGDNDERTRQLQEEIRRKIAARRGQSAPPPPLSPRVEPEPLFPVPQRQETAGEEPSPYKLPEPLVETATIDPVLERQRELVEQLAALKAAQQAEVNRASWAISKPVESEAQATAARADDIYGLRELRTARSLRKAMVLREVLGPPVALR